MAKDIKHLNYEPGDNVDTSDKPMTCPNGHPIRKMRQSGRLVCTVCDWTAGSPVMGTTPVKTVSKHGPSKPQTERSPGVQVISQAGVERRRKPRVIGGA